MWRNGLVKTDSFRNLVLWLDDHGKYQLKPLWTQGREWEIDTINLRRVLKLNVRVGRKTHKWERARKAKAKEPSWRNVVKLLNWNN